MHLSAGTRRVTYCVFIVMKWTGLLHTLFVGRQAGRHCAYSRFSIFLLFNPAQPPKSQRFSRRATREPPGAPRPSVRPSVSERGGLWRVRGGRGVERCERQGARDKVTGHGQLLLWRFRSPGSAGRLDGWLDGWTTTMTVRARGEPSGLFVT